MWTFQDYFSLLQQKVYIKLSDLENIGVLDSSNNPIFLDYGWNARVYSAFFNYTGPSDFIPNTSVYYNIPYGIMANSFIDNNTALTMISNLFDVQQNIQKDIVYQTTNNIAVQIMNLRSNKTYDIYKTTQYSSREVGILAFRNISLSDYQSSYLKIPIAYEIEGEPAIQYYLDSIIVYFYYTLDMEFYSYYERQPNGSGLVFVHKDLITQLMSKHKDKQNTLCKIASTENFKKSHRVLFDIFISEESTMLNDSRKSASIMNMNSKIKYRYEKDNLDNDPNKNFIDDNIFENIEEIWYEIAEGDEIVQKNLPNRANAKCLIYNRYAYNKYHKNVIDNVGTEYFSYIVKKIYYINLFPIFEICIENDIYIKANGDIKYVNTKLISNRFNLPTYNAPGEYLSIGGGLVGVLVSENRL